LGLEQLLEGGVLLLGGHDLARDPSGTLRVPVWSDVHNDEAVDHGGMASGEDHAVAPAHGVAHQDEVPQLQGLTEAFQVFHIGLAGVLAVGCPVAVSTPALIEGEDVVRTRHGLREAIPRVPMAPQSVEGNQRWRRWVAPFQIVEREAIDHHGLVHIRHSHRHLLPPFPPSPPHPWGEACSWTSAGLYLPQTARVRSALAYILRRPAAACSGNRQTPALPIPVPRVSMPAWGLRPHSGRSAVLTIASTGHTITHAPQLMHTGFQEQAPSCPAWDDIYWTYSTEAVIRRHKPLRVWYGFPFFLFGVLGASTGKCAVRGDE
jgi:hypothetical protein